MSGSITEKDLDLLMKMAVFQSKVMMHIPRDIVQKATLEAIASGDINVDDVPSPQELDRMAEQLELPLDKDSIN